MDDELESNQCIAVDVGWTGPELTVVRLELLFYKQPIQVSQWENFSWD